MVLLFNDVVVVVVDSGRGCRWQSRSSNDDDEDDDAGNVVFFSERTSSDSEVLSTLRERGPTNSVFAEDGHWPWPWAIVVVL